MASNAPSTVWEEARHTLDWFTPSGSDGRYQDPMECWGNAGGGVGSGDRGPIVRDGEQKKCFSPQSTSVLKALARMYDSAATTGGGNHRLAWEAGWRWETQAPQKANHRFFPPQAMIDELATMPCIRDMATAGDTVGLSSPQALQIIQGMIGDP